MDGLHCKLDIILSKKSMHGTHVVTLFRPKSAEARFPSSPSRLMVHLGHKGVKRQKFLMKFHTHPIKGVPLSNACSNAL